MEPLEPIIERCRWVSDGPALLSIVPELATAIPPIESWPIDDGLPHWVSPITGLDSVVGPLIEVIERAKSNEVDAIVHAQLDIAKADVFVARLVHLVRGLSGQQIAWVLMGVARWSTGIISGEPRLSQSLSPSLVRRIRAVSEVVAQANDRGALQRR